MNHNGTRAAIWAKDLCLLDTAFFSGANLQPSTVDFFVSWEATGPAEEQGRGLDVPADDKAAFRGKFAPAVATGWFSAKELGFSFMSKRGASSDLADPLTGYALIGTERNGEFLHDSS